MKLIPRRRKDCDVPVRRVEPQEGDAFAPVIDSFRREFDRLCDRFLGSHWPDRESMGLGSWTDSTGRSLGGFEFGMPRMDVSETAKTVTVRAEIPGVAPEDIDIEVSGRVLTISGEKRDSRESSDEDRYHTERFFGRFSRDVELPEEVDPEKVKARYDAGVLTVEIPKTEAAERRRIPIEAARPSGETRRTDGRRLESAGV